ncbi:hypothetical protein SO802_019872 [Lithocarpus litseifolius]|uniref:Pectinesterase inhibitor domain-containing protein n=1 Tax=Lithocarpus litseifolius TaxID=425828 RepID=A0AAW2CPX4_9ROSI
MVFKNYTFFFYVFLATVVILFTGHAHGAGLCDNSPNKQVCYSIVYTRTDPRDASVAACHKLIYEIKVATVVARRQARSIEIDLCINDFDSAIVIAKVALNNLKTGNYEILRTYLNGTQVYYDHCDNTYNNYGKTNPLAKSTRHLKGIASVELPNWQTAYIADRIHG